MRTASGSGPRLLLRGAALLVLAGLLGACATLPDKLPRGPEGRAMPPQPGGTLAEAEARVAASLGADRSGFHLLQENEEGLRWRIALADSAQHTIDLQYYCWWADESGLLLMKHVLAAADRGVKVRILLDDLTTMLADETSPTVRDRSAAMVDANPNIQIRLFNPWHARSLAGRGVESLEHMSRVNRRMHNKLMVADNRAAIVGGRNVGNEYFGLSPHFNFRDLDVLGIGPVARQASRVFDSFWNAEIVVPVTALGVKTEVPEREKAYAEVVGKLQGAKAVERFPLDSTDWSERLYATVAKMHAGRSRMVSDTPDEDGVIHNMPRAIGDLVGTSKRELLVTNAYIIPDEKFVERTKDLAAKGVAVRILTNSLASHDVPAVNSHYKKWRKPLIEAGAELHEMRADAAVQKTLADTPPTVAHFMGLHVKAMVVDRERVFIGSMNLDPRSTTINSEMGVIIESTPLAQELARAMDEDRAPANAWRVILDSKGKLQWTAGDLVLTSQPARNTWQRVQDVFFMLFPKSIY